MDKTYINNLIDEIGKIELGSVVVITRINNDVDHKYIVQLDNDYDEESKDIELISLQEKSAIWGVGTCETIEEVRESLLCSGIRKSFDGIKVLGK